MESLLLTFLVIFLLINGLIEVNHNNPIYCTDRLCNGGECHSFMIAVCNCRKVFQNGLYCNSSISNGFVNESFIMLHIRVIPLNDTIDITNMNKNLNAKIYHHRENYAVLFNDSDLFVIVKHDSIANQKPRYLIARNATEIQISGDMIIPLPDLNLAPKNDKLSTRTIGPTTRHHQRTQNENDTSPNTKSDYRYDDIYFWLLVSIAAYYVSKFLKLTFQLIIWGKNKFWKTSKRRRYEITAESEETYPLQISSSKDFEDKINLALGIFVKSEEFKSLEVKIDKISTIIENSNIQTKQLSEEINEKMNFTLNVFEKLETIIKFVDRIKEIVDILEKSNEQAFKNSGILAEQTPFDEFENVSSESNLDILNKPRVEGQEQDILQDPTSSHQTI